MLLTFVNSCIRSVSFADINYVQMTQIILAFNGLPVSRRTLSSAQISSHWTFKDLLWDGNSKGARQFCLIHTSLLLWYLSTSNPMGEGRGMVHTTYLTFTNQNESFWKGFQSHWRWFTLPASNVSWLVCHAYKLQRWVKFLIIIKYYTLSLEKTIGR